MRKPEEGLTMEKPVDGADVFSAGEELPVCGSGRENADKTAKKEKSLFQKIIVRTKTADTGNVVPEESCGFSVRKLTFTAMLGCLSFVLNTFVWFPHMEPFQHLCNVIGDVFVGPWWNFAAAFLTGSLRMMTGRDIQAVIGAVIGAWLGGMCYRRTHKLWAAWIGEVIGTGILSAMAAYPVLRIFYGFPKYNPFYLVPFYAPSAIMGASMGFVLLTILKKSGVLGRMLFELNRR
jgi:energy coupling factor transporter S component ThiW